MKRYPPGEYPRFASSCRYRIEIFTAEKKRGLGIDRILEPVFVGGERVGNDILWKIECRGSEKENLGKLNRSF